MLRTALLRRLPSSTTPSVWVRRVAPGSKPLYAVPPTLRWCATTAMPTAAASTAPATAAAATAPRAVGYWLIGCSGMVFAMVVLGGVTRLTRSGLSMVEWKPQGVARPTTDEEWQAEFDKYKQYPEYKVMNQSMTLQEFKQIWYMEWAHRTWGRAIGVAFAAPMVYFAARGMLPRALVPRIAAMLGLGGAQGLVGWWMVRSGLEEQPADSWTPPRVSPYRLAAHLGMAFSVYSMLLWTGMDVLAKAPKAAHITPASLKAAIRLKPVAGVAAAVIGLTAASGAFVAGNDAGHAYNDWPLMAGEFIPEQIWFPELGLRNLFENTATVQFDHRMLAYSSLLATGTLLVAAHRGGAFRALPPNARKALHSMGFMAATQVGLGISTLMMYVPVPLAAMHQAGALVLWSTSLWTLHALRRHAATAAARLAKAVA